MAHLSPEQLAGLAADPTDALAADDRAHLAGCPTCRDGAAALGDLVRDVRLARPTAFQAPSPEVWRAVERQLDADPADVPRVRHRRWLRPAVAAAAGLAVGVGGTLGVLAARPSPAPVAAPDLVARTSLAALPGESGEGTAELVDSADALQLRVHASLGPSPADDYHEVWLISTDGHGMYALGVLPASGDASYWLPAALGESLGGYRTVDISLEPEDGNAAHSQHSLVRGELPG